MNLTEESIFFMIVAIVGAAGILSLNFLNTSSESGPATGYVVGRVLCVIDCVDAEIEKIYPEIYSINKKIYETTQQMAPLSKQIKQKKERVRQSRNKEEKLALLNEIKMLEKQRIDLSEEIYLLQAEENLLFEDSIDYCLSQCPAISSANITSTTNQSQIFNSSFTFNQTNSSNSY